MQQLHGIIFIILLCVLSVQLFPLMWGPAHSWCNPAAKETEVMLGPA